jgi:Double zinc ribbon
MTCPRCQTENLPHAKFCLECAAPLGARCASCGAQLPPAAKFCSECAHPVSAAAAPASPTRFASPEAYTPKHLAERILTSKAALEGERKQVTVLFADMKESMELLADRDPEEARKILDPVRERMVDRADGPDHHHEPPDDPDVPPLLGPDECIVDVVGGDRDLGEIVEEVVEQDLRRQHRQERQEEERARHAEHVAKVRAGPHQQVLHHVAEGPPALKNSGVEDAEVALEQDDVGSVLGDVDGGRDGHADVRGVDGRRVVDAVAQEADDVVATLEGEDDAVLLRGCAPPSRGGAPTPTSAPAAPHAAAAAHTPAL